MHGSDWNPLSSSAGCAIGRAMSTQAKTTMGTRILFDLVPPLHNLAHGRWRLCIRCHSVRTQSVLEPQPSCVSRDEPD